MLSDEIKKVPINEQKLSQMKKLLSLQSDRISKLVILQHQTWSRQFVKS